MGFLVRARTRCAPLALPPSPVVARLLRRWEHVLGVAVPSSDGDLEDFLEDAFRLDATLAALEPLDGVYVTTDGVRARYILGTEERPVEQFPPWRVLGPTLRRQAAHGTELADRYSELTVFARHAGRAFVLCSHASEDADSELVAALVALSSSGCRRAVIKTTIPKYSLVVVDLPVGLGPDEARRLCSDVLGWALVHLDGVPKAFLVQAFVSIVDEYRLFVVGHEVVTGAGCVDEHTPLANDAPFDPKLRSERAARSVVRVDRAARDALVEFGKTVAGELALELPELEEYVLDVAFAEGAPAIVELNGLDNAGLYAADPYRLASARVASRVRSSRDL